MQILNWLLSRIALDPDAFSCAIIVAMLMVTMLSAVVIWAVWRVAYIKLWRYFRRKGTRK